MQFPAHDSSRRPRGKASKQSPRGRGRNTPRRGKGVRYRLCAAPAGPFRQSEPDPFSSPDCAQHPKVSGQWRLSFSARVCGRLGAQVIIRLETAQLHPRPGFAIRAMKIRQVARMARPVHGWGTVRRNAAALLKSRRLGECPCSTPLFPPQAGHPTALGDAQGNGPPSMITRPNGPR